jgi:transposase
LIGGLGWLFSGINDAGRSQMSLQAEDGYPIPEATRRVARAAFPKSTLCMQLADRLGTIYQDQQFAELFPARGQPALSPARLALATVLQFAEGLSDRQAADAVRGRIDWKYALALELTDPGFDHTVLSEFRVRLVAGKAELLLLDTLLARSRELGLMKRRGRQRTDSTHVLAAVRTLNRLERVGESLRAALNALAVAAPDWLRAQAPTEWYGRYGERVENYDLPKSEAERQKLALVIGADGRQLLQAIEAAERAELRELPAVRTLRRVWDEQYVETAGQVALRAIEAMPSPAGLIASPYDPHARYSTKRGMEWVGYKVQLTETCEPDLPSLIVNVETTPATTPDDNMLAVVHASLEKRDLLPSEHLVDKGYTDSRVLVDSQQRFDVEVIGPVADDPSWQAREGKGFDKAAFLVDWERRVVTCPAGKQSISWLPNTYPKNGMAFEARFARKDCTPCPLRAQCTRAKREPRIIGLQAREHHEALHTARRRQTTPEFRARYAPRAGIEATHEQAIRRCGLRRARYFGLARTHLQHIVTAAAINLVRLGNWWAGQGKAPTRRSRFAALKPSAAAVA